MAQDTGCVFSPEAKAAIEKEYPNLNEFNKLFAHTLYVKLDVRGEVIGGGRESWIYEWHKVHHGFIRNMQKAIVESAKMIAEFWEEFCEEEPDIDPMRLVSATVVTENPETGYKYEYIVNFKVSLG